MILIPPHDALKRPTKLRLLVISHMQRHYIDPLWEGKSCCHVAGFLNWSWSAFGRRYGFGVAVVGSFQRRSDGGFGSRSRELIFMILLHNTCRDPDRGQTLTTTTTIYGYIM